MELALAKTSEVLGGFEGFKYGTDWVFNEISLLTLSGEKNPI